ncbi:conserved Plasmodium protein, unknown function [Plasmodium sp. gorilla clade G3]|nr:conserved Plasmodium protein, unknown function [Plasmodium sp. gorilla clade G3]
MSTLGNIKNIVNSVKVVCDISNISPSDIVKKEEKNENKNKESYMLTTDSIDSTFDNIDNNECGDTTNVESTNEHKNGSYNIIDDRKKTEERYILEYDNKMKTKYYNTLYNYFDNKKYILINDKENKTMSKKLYNDNFMYQNNINKNITIDGNILKDEYEHVDDIRAKHKAKMSLCNNEFLYKYRINGKYGKESKRYIEESSFNELSKYDLICDIYNKKCSYYKEKKIMNKLNLSKKNLTDSEVENYHIGYNIKKNNVKRYLLSNDFIDHEHIEEKKKKKNMNIYQYRNMKENNILRNIYNNNNNNILNKIRMCYKNIPSFNYINNFNLLYDFPYSISENNLYKKKEKKKKLENVQCLDIYDNHMDSIIDNEDKLYNNNNNNVLKNEEYIENKKDLREIKRKSTNLKRNLNTDLISSYNLKKKMKKDNDYSFLHLNIYKNNNTYELCRNNSYNTYILKTVGNSYLKHKINEKKKKMKSTIINTINSNNTNVTDIISNKKTYDNIDIHMYGLKDKMFYHDHEERINNKIEEKDIKENKNESIETKNYINDKQSSKGTKIVIHKENIGTAIDNKITHDYILHDHIFNNDISNNDISNDNISNEYITYEDFTNNEDVNLSKCLNISESLNSLTSTNSTHINNMNSSCENETNCIPIFNEKNVDLLHLNLHDVVRMLENENIENLYTPEELKEILIPISGIYYSSSDGKWIYQYDNIDGDNNIIDGDNNIIDGDNNIIDVDNNIIDVDNNIIDGDNNIIDGDNNIIDVDDNHIIDVDNNIIDVDNNIIDGDNNIIDGDNNIIDVDDNHIIDVDDNHIIDGDDNHIIDGGDNHIIDGGDNHIIDGGDNHIIDSGDNHIIDGGDNHIIDGGDNHIIDGDDYNIIDSNNNIIDGDGKELNKKTSSEETINKSHNEKNIFYNNKYSFHEGRQLALMLKYKYIKRNHNIFKNLNDQEMLFPDINDHTNKEIYNDVDYLYDNKDNNEEHKMESHLNKYKLQYGDIYNIASEDINNMNEEEKCNFVEKIKVSEYEEENIKGKEQKEILKDEDDKVKVIKKIDDKETKIIKKIKNNDINLVQNIESYEKIHFCDKEIEENNLSNNKLKDFHLNETGHILKNEKISYNNHINSSQNINDIKNFNSSDNICNEEKGENVDGSTLLKHNNYDKKNRHIHFKNKKNLYRILGINFTKDIKNKIKCLEKEHIYYQKEKQKWIIQILEQKNNTILYFKEFDCKVFGFLYACFLSLEYKQLYLDYFINEKKQDYLLNLIQKYYIKKRKPNRIIHQLNNIPKKKKENNEEEEEEKKKKKKMVSNTNELSLNVGRYLYEKDDIINYQKKMENIKKNQYIDNNMEKLENVLEYTYSQNYYISTKDAKDNINIYKKINQNFIQNWNEDKINNEKIISIYEQNKLRDYNMNMLKNQTFKEYKDIFGKSKYGSNKQIDKTILPNLYGYNNMISICDKEKDIINKKYEKNLHEGSEKNILNSNIIRDDENQTFDHEIDTLLDCELHDKNQMNNNEQVDKDVHNFYIDKNICLDINSCESPILHDTHRYKIKNEKDNNINDIKESDDNFINLSNYPQNENEIIDKTLKKKRNNCSYKKPKNVKDSLAHYKNSNLSIELEEEERNNLIKLNNYINLLNEETDITSLAKQTILLLLKDILNSIPHQMAPSITSRKIYDRKIHAHVHFVYQCTNIIDLFPYFFIFKNIIKQKTLPSNQSLYICNVLLYALFEA